jgi:hypothetical protein
MYYDEDITLPSTLYFTLSVKFLVFITSHEFNYITNITNPLAIYLERIRQIFKFKFQMLEQGLESSHSLACFLLLPH